MGNDAPAAGQDANTANSEIVPPATATRAPESASFRLVRNRAPTLNRAMSGFRPRSGRQGLEHDFARRVDSNPVLEGFASASKR
jgi:hypothetical protein